MSLTQRLKQGFLRLPPMKKIILVSSATLMVSTVLPWYDQRNNFGVGDTFIGVQGPLFAVGLIVLGCGALAFFNMFLPLMGRNFFDLKRKSGSLALSLGTQSLLLMVVANSIFFHPDFAATINNKGTRFGMVVAFASIGAMMISGWWTRRKEKAGGETEERENEMEDTMAEPVMDEEVPVETSSYSQPSYSQPTYSQPSYSTPQERPAYSGSSYVRANETPATQHGVDPLTLDPKTRYKMMQSQNRYSSAARNNVWGSGGGSAYGAARRRMEEDSQY